jgi:hypothetical protein
MSMPPQQPPGWQQGPWPLPATPARRPRQEQHRVKWLLIAVAVLLVVGVTIGATLLFSRGNGGGTSTTSSSAPPSDVASANDRGAVAIITQEPTCQTFLGINDGLANVQKRGWAAERATLGPAAEWTPDQRSQVQVVTTAMRNAAEQSVALAKQTPHRVIRQLYEQFIAYGRAYADSLPTYTPTNNGLASANVNASSAIVGVCNAISAGSASGAVAVEPAAPPSHVSNTVNLPNPTPFIESSSPSCENWTQRLDRLTKDTTAWQGLDGNIPASEWSPERRTIEETIRPLLQAYADDIERAGRDNGNPVFEDFAVSAALYIRGYVAAGDDYTPADSWLSFVGFNYANLISAACRAAAG